VANALYQKLQLSLYGKAVMKRSTLPPLQQQLKRACRRLWVQAWLNRLIAWWSGGIALAIMWLLVQPLLLHSPPRWLAWAVAGSILSLMTIAASVVTAFKAPSGLTAALALDEKFDLRERVTTSVTLASEQAGSPAGKALVADANEHIRKLDVVARFPIRITKRAAILPALVAVLALVAVFYAPSRDSRAAAMADKDGKEPPSNASQIDQKMASLKRKTESEPRMPREKSEDLKQLEAELERIANRPRETKDQLRERIKEMTALEETMKNRERELADRTRNLKQQLQRLDQLSGKESSEGPAKDLQKALAEGRLDKASQEIERLTKRLQENKLSVKEKEQLKRQLEDLQKKLERLAKQTDKENRLRQANLDPETLKRELEQLKKEGQKLKGMQELAKQMGKCQKCLNNGDMEGAAQGLADAGNQLKKMDLDEENLSDLRDQLQRLEDAKESCCNGESTNQQEGDLLAGSGNPGIGAGKRPDGRKDDRFNTFDAKAKAEFDSKGKKIFEGYAPGQNFRKRNGADLAGEIKQASQEAPEAIEQQRIPKAARDMAKGYFQKMREQADTQR
jgi:hypothetical protein